MRDTDKAFHAAMEHGFNSSQTLAALFTFLRETNKHMWSLSAKDARNASAFMSKTLETLGLALKPQKTPKNIEKLAAKRELSRVHKHFIQADALRKKIERLGYMVEDAPLGPLVLKMTNF